MSLLTFLQHRLDLFYRPALARGQDTYATVVARADKSVRADLVVDVNKFQIGVRSPIEGDIKVAREHPP